MIFQSTPLMRGETDTRFKGFRDADISIHSPHARGDKLQALEPRAEKISIHSPHARGDKCPRLCAFQLCQFQSTPLMRGETLRWRVLFPLTSISIHSPHARGDLSPQSFLRLEMYFNPLPSCEGRPFRRFYPFKTVPISIHSPHARGDVETARGYIGTPYISIHSPHARGDSGVKKLLATSADFNPLPSCEGRRVRSVVSGIYSSNFNPLPSCEGRP